MEILGTGSRVIHPTFGKGVIIRLNKKNYDVCFIEQGIKQVPKDFSLEVTEKIDPDYDVSFNDAEEALIKILRTWSDVTEVTSLGDKWKNGVMILKPADKTLKEKRSSG